MEELPKIKKQFSRWFAFTDLKEAWEISLTTQQGDALIRALNEKFGKDVHYYCKWHPKDAGEPSRQGFTTIHVSHDCSSESFSISTLTSSALPSGSTRSRAGITRRTSALTSTCSTGSRMLRDSTAPSKKGRLLRPHRRRSE